MPGLSFLLGIVLVALFVGLAAFGPVLAPYPADATGAMHMALRLLPPSAAHWCGTDEMGDDILTRLLVGARTSLWVGLVVTGIAAGIGVPLGITAGYFGGTVRVVILRLTDIFLSVPGLVLALAIVAAIGPGLLHGVLALAVVWWPGYVRLIEAKALSLRGQGYVEAARGMGAGPVWVLTRHILLNCLSPLIIKLSMDMGLAILAAASLGFIGLGARPPAPEWGAMVSVARLYLPDWWWYSFFPGLAIFFTVLGFSLFGDGLRDALDPRA